MADTRAEKPAEKSMLLLIVMIGLAQIGVVSGTTLDGTRDEILSSVTGRVTLTAADEATFPGAGVRLVLACAPEPHVRVAIANERGEYRFDAVPAAGCTITTELQGFRPSTAVLSGTGDADLDFHLEVEPILSGLRVKTGVLPPGGSVDRPLPRGKRHDGSRSRRSRHASN